MKKLLFLIVFAVLVGFGSGSQATPLIGDGVLGSTYEININSETYTVANNQGGSFGYNITYGGYSEPSWSGFYLGTVLEENTTNVMSDLINFYLGYDYQYSEIKYDLTDAEEDANTAGSATVGPLTVTWVASLETGTWAFTDESGIELGFYAVKGRNDFALYYVDPFMDSGTWTTAHLEKKNDKSPAISHFSASAPVPEPATMMLFGIGLLGIAGVARRKK